MKGVEKSLKNNKTLNEGFSAWRNDNAPVFPFDKFNEAVKPLVELLQKYMSSNYVSGVAFRLNTLTKIDGQDRQVDFSLSGSNNADNYVEDGIDELRERCQKGEDQFNRLMFKTYIQFSINPDSVFGNYVLSTVNKGTNKISDLEDIVEYEQKDGPIIKVPVSSIINEDKMQKLMDYLN